MTQGVGARGQRVDTAELRAALENALGRRAGAQRRIAELERRPTPYCTSFAIEELDVRLADGTALELVFKDLGGQALLETARRIRPAFLYDPLRETQTYRNILSPGRLGTATCYGTVVDRRIGRYWLFLEKVPGLELYQVGEFDAWRQAARWLASMHSLFAGKTEPLARAAPLLSYDGVFYRLWMRRARAFLGQSASPRSRGARQAIEWLCGRYDQVVERLVALPVTFIHGEFYASNVLVGGATREARVCPIDWEVAAIGPGLVDLAALTAGKWTEDQRTALALAYHAALTPREDGWPPTPTVFLEMLDYCRLHLAIQWLGWSSDWSPPPEHAQDWLGEALSLAEKLGV